MGAPSVYSRIEFRLLSMECCHTLLCWVNPRYPTYCPQCGTMCYPAVRGWVTYKDSNATLRHKEQSE